MRSVIPRIPALASLLVALAQSLGCRAAPVATAPSRSTSHVPDNADAVAKEAVSARVTVELHLDRLQGFRFSKRLILLGGWNEALAGTGVDPLADVHRAFIAAHASHTGDVAIVLEHSAPEDRVAAAIAALQKKWLADHPARPAETSGGVKDASPGAESGGPAARATSPSGPRSGADVDRGSEVQTKPVVVRSGRVDPVGGQPLDVVLDPEREPDTTEARPAGGLPDLSRFPFPAAYRHMKNDFAHIDGPALVAEPHPGLIVVLPSGRAVEAFRFMEAGGLPAPRDSEAMVFRAWDPMSSIQNGPAWSPDVRYAEAVFTFDGEGNSTLKFRAVCTSAAAAQAQAAVMTTQVDDAQSLSVGGARLRLFDYIEFHAERDRVKMKTNLMADDVDWLVAMSMKPL